MPSGWDFGRFPTIFDDVPDDMRRMENLTHALDSANPKLECGETSHRRPHNTVRGPELADVLNSRNAMSASQCISQVKKQERSGAPGGIFFQYTLYAATITCISGICQNLRMANDLEYKWCMANDLKRK